MSLINTKLLLTLILKAEIIHPYSTILKKTPYTAFHETKSCCFQELLHEKPGTDSSE